MIDYNWKKTLSGERTQIRLPVKPGEWLMVHPYSDAYTSVHYNSVDMDSDTYNRITVGEYPDVPGRELTPDEEGVHRIVYQVGKTYAVQPEYRKRAVARIRILSIRREDVRNISDEDVKAEGFTSAARFFDTWIGMHDPKLNEQIGHWFVNRRAAVSAEDAANIYRLQMQDRPAERYEAWALTFEVVK